MIPRKAEHHFVLNYDRERGRWSVDSSTLDAVFPDGTIWDRSRSEWRTCASDDENPEETFFQELLEEVLERAVQKLNSTEIEVSK